MAGAEDEYIGWFLDEHAKQPIPGDVRQGFIDAYRGEEALRCGFECYRAFPEQARQVRAAVENRRVAQPVLAMIGGLVGDAIHGQLIPIAPNLSRVDIPDCGDLVPLERPGACAAALIDFAREPVSQ